MTAGSILYELASASVLPWVADLRPQLADRIIPDSSFQIQVAILALFHNTLAFEGWLRIVKKGFDPSTFQRESQVMYDLFLNDLQKLDGDSTKQPAGVSLTGFVSNRDDIAAIRDEIARTLGKHPDELPADAVMPISTLTPMLIQIRGSRYSAAWKTPLGQLSPEHRLAARFYEDLTGENQTSAGGLPFVMVLGARLASAHGQTVDTLSAIYG